MKNIYKILALTLALSSVVAFSSCKNSEVPENEETKELPQSTQYEETEKNEETEENQDINKLPKIFKNKEFSFTLSSKKAEKAYENGDKTFNFDNDSVCIVSYFGESENLIIPSEIDGIKVKEIGYTAFQSSGIKSAVIPQSIELLGEYAFTDCKELSYVRFEAENCKTAGDGSKYVFRNCDSLKTLTVGKDVKNLPQNISVIKPESENNEGKYIENICFECDSQSPVPQNSDISMKKSNVYYTKTADMGSFWYFGENGAPVTVNGTVKAFVVDCYALNIRVSPDIESQVKTILYFGDSLNVLSTHKNWSKVEYKGEILFAKADFLTTDSGYAVFEELDKIGKVYGCTNLNLRFYTDTSQNNVYTFVKEGATLGITGISLDGKWLRIKFGDQILYCASKFVKY